MPRLPAAASRAVAGSASLVLRLMSLGGKLALSLFMGKFFTLSELGLYGLAFGAVMLAVVAFGFRVDYVVAREILGMPGERRRQVGTEVAALYVVSVVLAAPLAVLALHSFGMTDDWRLLGLIYLVCGVEAYANFLYMVTVSLKRPALANALFFVRSGLWCLPVMVIAYLYPEYRTVSFVFAWWLAGTSASVVLNLWYLRDSLIAPLSAAHLRWRDIRGFIAGSVMIWLGSMAVTMGGYLDRFVLARYLTLDDVGVATFYTSFTIAALTLVHSATTTVTLPAMIEDYDSGRYDAFSSEVRRTSLLGLGAAVAILGGLAIAMPLMARVLGKAELSAAYPTFCLLLLATLIRTLAEALYYAIYVERKHRAVWIGNLLFFAASFAFNLLLIPRLGLIGLGLAAVFAALAVLVFRYAAYRRGIPRKALHSA
jgi:O-antigen/teichoic acid export membrane protein